MATRRDWLLISSALRRSKDAAATCPDGLDSRSVLGGLFLAAHTLADDLAAAAEKAGLRFDRRRFLEDAGFAERQAAP